MLNRKLSIKNLPEEERPREKLLNLGEQYLSTAELLALILGSGTASETAVQLAQRLIQEAGDLSVLSGMSPAELQKIHGIGPAKAASIKAALELSRRHSQQKKTLRPQFSNSKMVFDHFHAKLYDKKQEEFWVASLDTKNKLISAIALTKGTLLGSLVHPREVFLTAIKNSAAGILVLHNHPSGDPEPSFEDRKVTTQLSEAAKLIGIPLLDHLIIGNHCYFSFKDQGLL